MLNEMKMEPLAFLRANLCRWAGESDYEDSIYFISTGAQYGQRLGICAPLIVIFRTLDPRLGLGVRMKSKASLFLLLSVSLGLSLTPTLAQEPERTASFGQSISVLGEVQKPGVYAVTGPCRLFDLLSLAGGTTAKAGQRITITHRGFIQQVILSNDPQKNGNANVEIVPGDTVVVGKAGIVYVVGDVHKPSGIAMENGRMTVLQAISMAEGTNPTAALNHAKLIRTTPSGPQEMPLALKKILDGRAPDVHLQAEDIVLVPSSANAEEQLDRRNKNKLNGSG